ncbi:SCO1860 family LAETG-anchored protein [Streptomyces pactum]|uniref:SCO1860 family LAETG-anchored protein n=1 Tax=Streptomyces pactum TaxID=68249 RepID=UPI0027DB3A6B|nr:SCO1860 family LAETG-anchored protein [Streptomyces pactum]
MPARRLAAAAAVTATTVLLGAAPAHATGSRDTAAGSGTAGKADAVVLRTALDVSLLDKTAQVPVNLALNEVSAPAAAHRTLLTTTLTGVEGGKPVQVLRADVATAKATADRKRAEGYTNLVRARVHLPGLPARPLVELEQVTAKAVCEAGKRPYAETNPLGDVFVLGQKVALSATGTTTVTVPAVGEVRLDLSRTATTSRTAAATALGLRVSVDPLALGVAKVDGQVTLAAANCTAPAAAKPGGAQPPAEKPAAEQPGPAAPAEEGPKPQGGTGTRPENLAETGGSSSTPYVAGGAAALVAVGAGALVWARRRRIAAARNQV